MHAYRGTVSVVPVPDAAQLDELHDRGRREQPHRDGAAAAGGQRRRGGVAARPVPLRAGDPSLIEHVVYIIKENRTYDQLFGDLPRGNGDPSLVMFGDDVTPNHRKLATEFVLLDNFYATGGNSGDGHQWVTQANETSYALWPGYVGRSYPFDGTDPIAYANTGFLWDLARARGQDRRRLRRVRRAAAGERHRRSAPACSSAGGAATTSRRTGRSRRRSRRSTPCWRATIRRTTQSIPDVVRAQIFLKDLDAVDAAQDDAEPRHPAAAERSHARRNTGLLDAEGDGG